MSHRFFLPACTTALVIGLVPLAAGLAPPAAAAADASRVVISEVYGGGGSGSSAFRNDYVELYNPTAAALSVDGTSVQYRSAGGSANPTGVTPLSGSVPAKGYYLVALGGGAAGAALPTPDASGSTAISASAGTIFLADQTTALAAPPTGSVTGNPAIIDLVGYGSSNTFESAPTSAPSAATSVARDATGKDTDANSADLVVAAGTPGAAPAGSGPATPPESHSIAEIQGTGDASPLVGRRVITDGVVTAAYPTGGINGFYLQTAGSGGDTDPAGREASDAVYVYGSAVTSAVQVGDHVEVTGEVSEFKGLTEVTPAAASDVRPLSAAAAPRPATIVIPEETEQREAFEGMLLAPQGDYTVADNYTLNQYAEIGLAIGNEPLWTPTEVADAQDTEAIAAVEADNAARRITLDDGASLNFLTTSKDVALPWLTRDREIRVGAPATFTQPMVLDWRNSSWRLQPSAQLTADDAAPVTFGHTRTATPQATGGNVHVASFNVLNYFPTTGEDVVSAGGTCSWYDDRAGEHVTVRSCTPAGGGLGPRGAADAGDLARQQAKIVRAINALDAGVVSLEEMENSAVLGKDRDDAVSRLVEALNTEAGAGTWSFVPSPAAAADQSDEDVIRTAFIYRSAQVRPVGESLIDDVPVFDVARDPLAQAFEPVGGGSLSRFAVIVNHFKSKSSGPDDGTGQGKSNPQRVAEAEELVRFADQVKTDLDTGKVLLSGDFNAYSQEDPMQVLHAAGFTDIGNAKAPGEHTYLYGGTVGSLDHVLGNDAAMARVTGAHVWNINSVEPVALEYSRHNYNLTDFYDVSPFRASDHDPLVVGLELPIGPAATSTSAAVTPDPVRFKIDEPSVRVAVESVYGTVDGGTVEVRERGRLVGHAALHDGVATITLPRTNKKGRHDLVVRYLGTDDAAASTTTASYRVEKKLR